MRAVFVPQVPGLQTRHQSTQRQDPVLSDLWLTPARPAAVKCCQATARGQVNANHCLQSTTGSIANGTFLLELPMAI